jgi:hypothetical protein
MVRARTYQNTSGASAQANKRDDIDIQDFLWDSDNGTLHLELFIVLILYVILFFFFNMG